MAAMQAFLDDYEAGKRAGRSRSCRHCRSMTAHSISASARTSCSSIRRSSVSSYRAALHEMFAWRQRSGYFLCLRSGASGHRS